MKITQTNGNRKNGIRGSRLTIRDDNGNMIDQFEVPSYNARKYCEKFPDGKYGQRLERAIKPR